MLTKQAYQLMARDLKTDRKKATIEITESLRAGQLRPDEFSVRKLAEHLVPDGREWVESMDPDHSDYTFLESAGAISLSDFSNVTGQIAFSAVLSAYNDEEFIFTRLIPTVPTRLSGEKIPGMGRIGDKAEVVGEGQAYPQVGINEDWIETPATVKRGMISSVTKEAIFFDRMNVVLKGAAEVGHFMGVNKEKRAIDVIIDENTTAGRYKWKGTSYATYATSGGHGVVNKKASNGLVDWTNIDAALLVASAIVDPWTGEPTSFMGSDLIVTPQLVSVANHIVNATLNQRATPGYATSANPNVAQLNGSPILGLPGYSAGTYNIRTSKLLAARLATDTHWFIGDIAGSFACMENWGLTLDQAAPGGPKEFEQDIVAQFKVSSRDAFTTMDVRKIIQNTA